MPAEVETRQARAGATIIDGAAIARDIRAEVADGVAALKARGVTPGLSVILVGDDPASAIYVRSKERACVEAGMNGETILLPAATPEDELLARIDALNDDPAVHGILVQMPLPKHIRAANVLRRVRPEKDVDGFHPLNAGKLVVGDGDGFVPCTPAGVRELLLRSGAVTRGANCVVVGRSNVVGKPMAALMVQCWEGGDATVTVCHRETRDLAAHTRAADILIVAVGRAHLVTADMVKPGAVVIDVGQNRIADPTTKSGSRLVGDVDFAAVREVASLITPVPGGVGPMTIAMLLKNTLRSAALAAELAVA